MGLRPIQFASKRFPVSQRKNVSPWTDFLAMILGIERFYYYIYGRKFTLLTDHDTLKWLKSVKSSNKKFFKWTSRLNEYDFNVLLKPWPENGDADGLSRFQVFSTFFTYEKVKVNMSKGKETKLS